MPSSRHPFDPFEPFDRARLVPHRLGVWVDGVEVTQGIQYSRSAEHLTDPADRKPDNAVRLVADKAAWVRVYVRARWPVPGLTATAVLQRRRRGVWVDAEELAPQGTGTMTADPSRSYADERGSLASSLNFRIPAALMRGNRRVRVEVRSDGGRTFVDSWTVDVRATLLQTLHVRGFAIQYDGPDAAGDPTHLPAPSLADFQTSVAWTLLTWPVSQTPQISILGPTLWTTPLTGNITVDATTGQAQCPTAWNDLLGWLALGRFFDGNRQGVLYHGLLPNGVPVGQAAGCGGGVVAATFTGQGQTMAHELGHATGFGHAPCGLVAGDMGDPAFPAYEPYGTTANPTASIGEYGLDVNTGQIASPAFARDTMSYCGPRWPSLYHYQGLLQHDRLHPEWIADPAEGVPPWAEVGTYDDVLDRPDPPDWFRREVDRGRPPEQQRLFAVVGRLNRGRPEVDAVVRIEMLDGAASGVVDGMRLELLDGAGEVVSSAPVRYLANTPCGGGCGGCGGCGGTPTPGPDSTASFEAYALDDDGTAAVRLVRDGEEVWARQGPSTPPQVDDLSTDQTEGELHVRWHVSAEAEQPLVALRWSADEGRSWSVLGLNLSGDGCTVPTTAIAAREGWLQLAVSDGFHTTLSEPVPFELPEREPQAAILFPPDGALLRGGPARLWGLGTSDVGEHLTDEALRWFVDGDEVGAGTEVWLDGEIGEGDHEVTLVAEAGGPRGTRSHRFTVLPGRADHG